MKQVIGMFEKPVCCQHRASDRDNAKKRKTAGKETKRNKTAAEGCAVVHVVFFLSDTSRRDKFIPLPLTATVRDALEQFVSQPYVVHRLVLCDQNKPVQLLSQSDFLQYFVMHVTEISSEIPEVVCK